MTPLRDTLLNLAITCVLVLIIVLVAILLKESRPEPAAAVPVGVAQVPPGQAVDGGPAPLPEFKVYPRAKLIESRANEADTLRFKLSDTEDEHVFALYFVDALDASWTHPQRVQEQARYFGVSGDQVVAGGQQAVGYVYQLLKERPFTVMTRWEQVPERSRYYAIVLVEHRPGSWVYLADLLVQQGHARVAGVTTSLPSDPRSARDYALELQALRKQAQQNKAGIWALSKL